MDFDIATMPLVFIDVETTGFSPTKCRITEIAALRVENGEIVRKVVSLFSIDEPVPEIITKLTGIDDAMLEGQPPFDTVCDQLIEILDGAIMVAHNAKFDYSFIKAEFERAGKPFVAITLCTCELVKVLYPTLPNHKLQTLIETWSFEYTDRHRAEDDAAVLIQLLKKIGGEFDHDRLRLAVNGATV